VIPLYALGSQTPICLKEVYMLRKVSLCDNRKRSRIKRRLSEEEAKGGNTNSSHHGDNTRLAAKARSSVVIVGSSRGAGGSTANGSLDLGAGSVGLGLNVALGVAVVVLDPGLCVTALLGSPLLDFVGVGLGPLLDVGDLFSSLGLSPVLEVVAEVTAEDGGLGDLGGSLRGDEAGSGEDSDLGEEHDEDCLFGW
jgi:hypothetical protein